ncbi:MAG: biopolymer transporter ExbB [Candidatus Liberibacter europaeus]|uniref:Biopolymer transporter ExbB n=1 Tax=Candidatus Liberibacter europaeus TaxID=744859 RepID=A0A2T4VXI5_9HYPH|nr:biopolymer transporter ExbB [Candidatus Liberibacter europaeus]PTL86481.1 MAG: biopolymer transporter ExbB [Candidatus Liberibacter europaeus]
MNNTDLSVVNLNIFSFFMQTGISIKCIIILLILFSIVTWSIIIQKTFGFVMIRRNFTDFEHLFWSGQSLEELYKLLIDRNNIGLAAIFISAMREWKKSLEKGSRSFEGIQDRIDRMMNVAIAREFENIIDQLSTLSIISSVGLLIGLLGTVLGIMDSLQMVMEHKHAGIAVISTGLIGSLISMIIGLFVSIPSSVAYNKFTEDSRKLLVQMEGFADEFSAIISRQIE